MMEINVALFMAGFCLGFAAGGLVNLIRGR